MRRIGVLLVFFCVIHLACAQGEPRILVRGQEIVFESLHQQNGALYISSADRALLQVDSLLASGKPSESTSNSQEISLSDLAKRYNANLSYDSERIIWYIDPRVNGVTLSAGDDKVIVEVQSSVRIQPTIIRLENPPRLAIDFPYSVISENAQIPAPPPHGLIEKIEMAQYQAKPNVVRVVIHLSGSNVAWSTSVNEQTKALDVTLSPILAPAFQAESGSKNGEEKPALLGGIELKSDKDDPSGEKLSIHLKLSGPAAYAWKKLRSPDNRVYIDFLNCLQGMGKSINLDNPYFEIIRVAQFQRVPVPIVRVVLQLKSPYHVEVGNSTEGMLVTVSSRLEDAGEVLSGGGTTGFNPAVGSMPGGPVHPNGIVLVLDPGHGGSDPGARGRALVEKDVTLDIGERLRDRLVQDGFTVILTRTGDQDVLGYHGCAKCELQARVDVGRHVNAALFVSLHINSSDYGWPHGVQTHWYKRMDLPLATTIQHHLGTVDDFSDRGVMRDRFYVLHHSRIPSVLIEMGFISNSHDEAKLESSDVRDELAEAISRGIVEYSGVERNAHL